jgi:hypothetical protein
MKTILTTNEIIEQLTYRSCPEELERIKEYCDKEIKLINDKVREIAKRL